LEKFENQALSLAEEFVHHTGCNIFLTGKAGTGKTTFLHGLQGKPGKRMVITAPTGVAAINAGGVTLHSFFQLPFTPHLPGNNQGQDSYRRFFRFSKEKKRVIKSLDLLVIDEISMVRADLLDAVDEVLRRLRRNDQPFGGVQLLLIGDLHQLAPVARPNEWNLLREHYSSVYFFSSHALNRAGMITIELEHIYRQTDNNFINLLNRVRNNNLERLHLDELNSRYTPGFTPDDEDGYITLTTHNTRADATNKRRLEDIQSKTHLFRAEVADDFPQQLYPASLNLELKKNAQVLFVRNDPSGEKKFYNGKIGKVVGFKDDMVIVRCPGDEDDIAVKPLQWENIKYVLNEEKEEIEPSIIGSFNQLPLKLAWAITIHKSQGLTFERAMIDGEAAFTHGQIYVALSRCRSMEGLVLTTPLATSSMRTDQEIADFDDEINKNENTPDRQRLQVAKKEYQHKLLLECFDFGHLRYNLDFFVRIILGNRNLIQVIGHDPLTMPEQAEELFVVGVNFSSQLQKLIDTCVGLPSDDAMIRERLAKASLWFEEKIKLLFIEPLAGLSFETDNKELSKRLSRSFDFLLTGAEVKLAGVKSCRQGFSARDYLHALSRAELRATDVVKSKKKRQKQKQGQKDFNEADLAYPDLFRQLSEWRNKIADDLDIPRFQVMHQRVLGELAASLPARKSDLEKIKGVGKKTIEKYGDDLVEIISRYRKDNDINEVMVEKNINTAVSETKQKSFVMFKEGVSVRKIAAKRELAISTIEGHLASFVSSGDIAVTMFITQEKQTKAVAVLDGHRGKKTLTEVKEILGDDYSYGEIRMVLAHLDFVREQDGTD
jgi:hypothetical protein